MANETETGFKRDTKYDTALCFIPPRDQWDAVDAFRQANDKAFGRWPPHVNLLYPFVPPRDLDQTLDQIISHLRDHPSNEVEGSDRGKVTLSLDSADCFPRQRGGTFFLFDGDADTTNQIHNLRSEIIRSLSRQGDKSYRLHMTVGQCDAAPGSDAHSLFLEKIRLLPKIQWEYNKLFVLVRNDSGVMLPWATIDLDRRSLERLDQTPFYNSSVVDAASPTPPRAAHRYSNYEGAWFSLETPPDPDAQTMGLPEHLVVASYNVLAEFASPPTRLRYPLLIENLLSPTALADVLVLQEVTDDFLSYLLQDKRVRDHYRHASHAPPHQPSVGPLPNLLNVVVLSRHFFTWRYLPFCRSHKGACIAVFSELGTKAGDGTAQPLVVAGCHLSQGLTDDLVGVRWKEFQHILTYLKGDHASSPWIIAGDFNVVTSYHTLQSAVESKTISAQAAAEIRGFDARVARAGLTDAWAVARTEVGESSDDMKQSTNPSGTFEGEQGATFDPPNNPEAAKSASLAGTKLSGRPQRYDRILLKTAGVMNAAAFNMFGFLTGPSNEHRTTSTGDRNYASDHWGIRCLLRKQTGPSDRAPGMNSLPVVPVTLKHAGDSLSGSNALNDLLLDRRVRPTSDDENVRTKALDLLREVLLETGPLGSATATRGGQVVTVLVPLGSYGLGVWSPDSDLDCLFIGSVQPRTFFRLAKQRIRKCTSGMRLLRIVRANTGTMLELEVLGIRVDLQYGQASHIAERWPDVMKRPSTDGVFKLKPETLLKLKPARDLSYLKRSIPDLAQYRIAHRLIKCWAQERGIYAAKFGYLGGIHISILLVRVCKMLWQQNGPVSTPDLLVTFFDHYSSFDWEKHVVFDPFFHKNLRYHRAFREPMCLLGWHGPILNAATAASKPNVRTIAAEFRKASEYLSQPDVTWAGLLGSRDSVFPASSSGTSDFLEAYPSYVKLSVQYWGKSLEKGSRFLGWLESRCISLLVDLSIQVKDLSARIWPQRFVDAALDESNDNYQGLYLIGLSRVGNDASSSKHEDAEATMSKLRSVLDQFERQIREYDKYFDASISWFETSVVRGTKLGPLRLDLREWGLYAAGDEDSDDEFLDEDDDEEESEVGAEADGQDAARPQKLPVRPKPEGAGKLRSAWDVMNRLRWDPNMDSDDYVIGYLDRFEGVQEKPLGSWQSEQTDEEFIPQHRIVYFKRKSDASIVWERHSRTDKIFGSGQG